MCADNVEERHRLKRTPAFKPSLIAPGDPKRKPGKLVAQESAYLRRTGGVDVPRAHARRIIMRVITDTIPVIAAENRRFSRRLQLRGKHVPASLTVAPAHQWNISDESLDHITALIDLTAKMLAKGAHTVADNDRRVTVVPNDIRLVKTLRKQWGL